MAVIEDKGYKQYIISCHADNLMLRAEQVVYKLNNQKWKNAFV